MAAAVPPVRRAADASGLPTERDDAQPRRSSRGPIVGIGVVVALLAAVFTGTQPALADTAPAEPTTPTTVSSDALPTAQIDGVAWSQVVVGNTVYVAGSFTTARPYGSAAGVNTVTRNNLLAYDITTGNLISSFAPSLNAQARTIVASPDGSRIYVGGDFTSIDGVSAYRIAAFSTATGARIMSFRPVMGSTVRGLAATNDTLYAGGYFQSVNGVTRSRAAALKASDASVLPWAPQTDNYVTALQVSPDGHQVVLGGAFTTLNGSSNPGYGLAAVDSVTAALITPFGVNNFVRNGGNNAAVYSLSSDGTNFYGTGYVFGAGGNLEGTFSGKWSDGSMNWVADCHGDTYDSYPMGDVVYTVSHAHYCGNIGAFPQTDPWTQHYSLAFSKAALGVNTGDIYGYPDHPGQPAPKLEHWFPEFVQGTYTGQGQAGWNITGNDKYVVVGGEFRAINGVFQQGLTRFAVKSIAPNLDKPRLSGANYQIKATALGAGAVRVAWPANWDRDNENLTYSVIRNGATATPVYVKQQKSNFWTLPNMSYTDRGLTAGQSYTYRVRVTDPLGNFVDSASVTSVASSTPTDPYTLAVLNDNPNSYWPLGEPSGSSALDWAGANDLSLGAGVTRGAPGAMVGSSTTASTFSGTDTGFGVTTGTAAAAPDTFTAEAWIKTTTTSGGKILGFGSSATGNSGSYDRHVYMDNSGKILFGVYPGSTQTVNSSSAYNDGQWHHVVASLGSGGMKLYVDGKVVGSRTDVTTGQAYTGYWRVGGDNIGGWPNQPSSNYFNGDIDDVAVYPTVLDRTAVINHYVASGRTSPIPAAPTDTYGASVYNLDPTLYWRLNDASGSTAVDAGPNENPGTYTGNVTKGATGALSGNPDKAAAFAPVNNNGNWTEAGVASTKTFTDPEAYSVELWFQTTTHNGGKLIGFGAQPTGTSSSYDRHVYLENDGRLTFGTYTGQTNTITTPNAYNDGAWHQVVASQSSDGLKLYVDGALVGTNATTQAQNYTGYWRIGGDTTWGGTAPFYTGKLDEVAVYDKALTPAQVNQHYVIGSGNVPNQAPTAAFTSHATDLSVAFDATGSSDSDGVVSSYAWDFGDGTTGTGATPTHPYAASGDYTVTLTVTDDDGATATVQHPVTVLAANVVPTAAFTTTANNLTLNTDATTSVDPDGTITAYAWSYGDGQGGTGATSSHTYTAAGNYDVTLTVTDNRGATATVTHTVTVSAPVLVPPVASFTTTATDLNVSFDGSASTDPDGSIVSYAWAFGDGANGIGATVQHSYPATGSYVATLTVTDNSGATGTATKTITVTAPPAPPVFAQDRFERSVTAGLGSAETGGAWSLSGGNAPFSVGGGKASVDTPAGATRRGILGAATGTDSEVAATFSFSEITGTGVYASAIARRVGTDDYRGRLWVRANGSVVLQTMHGGTVLQQLVLPGVTYTTGDKYTLRVQVTGSNPTTVKARAWKVGSTEPTTWQVTSTDTTAALQGAGAVGFETYLGGTATKSVVVGVDDFLGRAPVDGPLVVPTAPANVSPTASFAASNSNLTVSVDGSASVDPDGTIASYGWAFGDGATATGATASHAYTNPGTYTVTLTVTDNAGATGTATKQVTVTAPPPNVPPTAAFTATATDLALSVDGSTSTDPDGTIASYGWDFGDSGTGTGATASHTYTTAGTYTVTLTVTDNAGATAQTTRSVTVTAPVVPPVDPPATTTLGADTFERAVTAGWGTADTGVAWTLSGGNAAFTVAAGTGQAATPSGGTRRALLAGVSATDVELSGNVSFASNITGSGVYESLIARRVGTDDYRARLWVRPTGVVVLQLMHGATLLQQVVPAGLAYAPGDVFTVKFQAVGTNPTTLNAKVWKVGATEPTAWQVTATDTTAALQAAGAVGVETYLGGTATEPVTVVLDAFLARKPN
ncbi:PKD domain-containing protein [Plantibacter sp. YIM 135347]|uniref:PKD domain-containing protein n=1 Tax=Plantibacter sp. YIM 135347 TaxID=3423919 RepID=UPI003D34893C